MNLQQFVASTIAEAVAGVSEAQAAVAKHGARISPSQRGKLREKERGTKNPIHILEFDVAVAVTRGAEKGASARLMIPVIRLGAGGKIAKSDEHSEISRVKFTVPIRWPVATE